MRLSVALPSLSGDGTDTVRRSHAEALLDEEDYRGFPVVKTMRTRVILGYIGRAELWEALSMPHPWASLAASQ
mgnify:CR=1 FL=1